MDESTKKSASTSTEDSNNHDSLFNLKRLKDGYLSIMDKVGHAKFKPYLQRLFHSIELIVTHEIAEFKKIDAKYQDMVRQCHTYEKTLALLKENTCDEPSTFNESSNTYALDDLTKVTPFVAPDLLQSTLAAPGGGSTSIQFRLPLQLSSLPNRQFVSTPLGPSRAVKPIPPLSAAVAPVAQFDDDDYSSASLILTNSLGFPHAKQYVDAFTEPDYPHAQQQDFACQMAPICIDRDSETIAYLVQPQTTQTETIITENIACQITPVSLDCSLQANLLPYQQDFSCQMFPISVDQASETIPPHAQPQSTQTETSTMEDFSNQMTPISVDQEVETISVSMHECASQSECQLKEFDDRQIQTEIVSGIDVFTQYDGSVYDEPDTRILPIILNQELSMPVEIPIVSLVQDAGVQAEMIVISPILLERECQTIGLDLVSIETQAWYSQCDGITQTTHISIQDCASQSSILSFNDREMQTEPFFPSCSSSLFIVPTSNHDSHYSSTVILIPSIESSSPTVLDQAIQCDFISIIPVESQPRQETKTVDRRSLIQQRMDEKEKQMNRIIEEYAMLYGEYESERRRNMDLTEARDRLADHIKVLSDELGDREITQEKLLIRSGQQNKLINYMLPHIDCSPTPKKKHHSTNSFRRLLPKFK